MHLYFKLHYRTRIKGEYLRRYAVAKKAYEDATEEDKESGDVKKIIPIVLRNAVGKEFWLLESAEFSGGDCSGGGGCAFERDQRMGRGKDGAENSPAIPSVSAIHDTFFRLHT